MFDVSLYTLSLIVHVAAASILLGSAVAAPLVRRSMMAAERIETLRLWVEFDRGAARMDPPAAMVLLATGIYLGSLGWWTAPWFYVSVGTWILNSALAIGVLQRKAARLAAAIGDREGLVDGATDALRRARAWDIAHDVMRATDLAMLYVMFQKPGLTESLLVTGAAITVSIGIGARRARSVASSHGALTQPLV